MTAGSEHESTLGWSVEQVSGSAQSLHDAEADFSGRLIRVNNVSSPALVLGSTQNLDLVDTIRAEASGVQIARRRSGGGIVSLQPGAQCWVDVFIPADDPLWVDDVDRSSLWLGESWARVAARFGWTGAEVYRGVPTEPELARLACFGSLAAGEVYRGRHKLVGISQRRTRLGAKFQCTAYLRFDASPILDLVELGPLTSKTREQLMTGVGALSVDASDPGWSVVECLLAQLP